MNHPLPRTSTIFLEEQIRQGTDVLIALMVVVAQCFVPASLGLALVQERRRRTKHLQLLCGLHGAVYWLANYCWDLVSRCRAQERICHVASLSCYPGGRMYQAYSSSLAYIYPDIYALALAVWTAETSLCMRHEEIDTAVFSYSLMLSVL